MGKEKACVARGDAAAAFAVYACYCTHACVSQHAAHSERLQAKLELTANPFFVVWLKRCNTPFGEAIQTPLRAGAGAHSAPARRTDCPHRAGSVQCRQARRQDHLVGRRGAGELNVADGLRQDLHDLGVPAVDSDPAFPSCPGKVVSGDGVVFSFRRTRRVDD